MDAITAVMSQKKKPGRKPQGDVAKESYTIRLSPDIIHAFHAYLAATRRSRSPEAEIAFVDFLKAQGFWPPKK